MLITSSSIKWDELGEDDFKRRKQLQNDGNSVMLKNVHVYDKTKVCLRVILTRIETFPPYYGKSYCLENLCFIRKIMHL